jgi:uncharacterized protein YjiS (DUF1127 family)
MACADFKYSCNSIISIRSPPGEIRIGAPKSAAPSARPLWLLFVAIGRAREWFEHRKQKRALARLDKRLLDDIGLSKADVWERSDTHD